MSSPSRTAAASRDSTRFGPCESWLCAALALVLQGACDIDTSEIGRRAAPSVDAATTRADAGRSAGDARGGDAGLALGAGADAKVSGALGRHPSCTSAPRGNEPEPDTVAVDAWGRPAFDLWRDLACGEVSAFAVCRADVALASSWGCDGCVQLEAGSSPVCSAFALGTVACDTTSPRSAPLVYRDGSCLVCVTMDEKRRACCDDASGVDCRAWPFEQASGPMGLCARHADCAEGLVCRSRSGWGYGLCTCPESAPTPPSLSGCGAEP